MNFVPKAVNPPNVPQCRPIENFFGALATKVYAGNWVPKDTHALVARIRRFVRELSLQVVHDMMTTTWTKLQNTYSVIHTTHMASTVHANNLFLIFMF